MSSRSNTNAVFEAFRLVAEPGRLITDLLWTVAGYVPTEDDGYVSVQITNTTCVDGREGHYGGRPALHVEFHDYGHPANVHSIVLTLDEDDPDQFEGWDFDATLEELRDEWRAA